MLVVIVGIFLISKQNLLEDRDSLNEKRDRTLERMNTQITIENATYTGTTLNVTVRNEGSTTLKTSYLDLYLNQERILRNDTAKTVTVRDPDIINPGLWDPDEVIEILLVKSLADNNYTVTVVTEYSVSDSKIFEKT